ncbi:type III secretion protein HrpB2 [Trinickia acidisoli]|uniref:type III secretion protein HrpB2 n=1 Tax=Trinickia acidisoli TaxID=2767482 RepID=UPI001A906ECE|nr:type III secretion protein HrpB2 [Trinickia acidisoli]
MNSMLASMQLQQLLAHESAASAPGSASTQQLADKFQVLYERGHMTPPQAQGTDTETMISNVVRQQDLATQAVSNDALFMIQSMPQMTMQQSFAAQAQVMMETSGLQCDMQVKLAVVTSTKDAIGTLMRNQ